MVHHMTRALWLALGGLLVVLGIIGAFLPLMPTTIFLILAAGACARGSPRLEAWILNHKSFGPSVRAWRERGAIPKRGKVLATAGIAVGYVFFHVSASPSPALAIAVAVMLLAVLGWIYSRPS